MREGGGERNEMVIAIDYLCVHMTPTGSFCILKSKQMIGFANFVKQAKGEHLECRQKEKQKQGEGSNSY